MDYITHQAPQSMEFSRQEYWSGLPFHSPGDLPNPGIEPRSPALQMDFLPSEPPEKHKHSYKPAAAAAKSLPSCPTLCDPMDSSPPGSPVPGILQARTLESVAISFSSYKPSYLHKSPHTHTHFQCNSLNSQLLRNILN